MLFVKQAAAAAAASTAASSAAEAVDASNGISPTKRAGAWALGTRILQITANYLNFT